MSGFVEWEAKHANTNYCDVMSMLSPEHVPIISTLASEFAIMDHMFAAHPGPTWYVVIIYPYTYMCAHIYMSAHTLQCSTVWQYTCTTCVAICMRTCVTIYTRTCVTI